jgi:hypothetical protein
MNGAQTSLFAKHKRVLDPDAVCAGRWSFILVLGAVPRSSRPYRDERVLRSNVETDGPGSAPQNGIERYYYINWLSCDAPVERAKKVRIAPRPATITGWLIRQWSIWWEWG